MQAQPFRRGKGRHPGAALDAMLAGRSASGGNPQDVVRGAQLLVRASKRRRPQRPARPQRPPRPQR